MNLKDFIRDTLVQITDGVKEAQEDVKGNYYKSLKIWDYYSQSNNEQRQ